MRFKKEEDVSGSNIVIYSMYSGNNAVIQEKYDGATLIETRFNIISGGKVLGHIRKVYGTSENYEYFYLDNLSSRRVVLDNAGALLDKFTYSAYGEVTHTPSSNDYLASFTGKEYDATGFIYFNARYFDPVVGRFLTEDSVRDGLNYYNYCKNNPVNFTDPDGHRSRDDMYNDYGYDVDTDTTKPGESADDTRKRRNRRRKGGSPTELGTAYLGLNLSITNPLQLLANLANKVQDLIAPEAVDLFESNIDSFTYSGGIYIDMSNSLELGLYGSTGAGFGTPDVSIGIESGSSGLSADELLKGTTYEVGGGLGTGVYLQQGNIFNESEELIGTEFSTGIGIGSPVDIHFDQEKSNHFSLFDFGFLFGK